MDNRKSRSVASRKPESKARNGKGTEAQGQEAEPWIVSRNTRAGWIAFALQTQSMRQKLFLHW